ncbi:MAG: hypothetical protein LAT80_04940 [Balneolaceae bacterium]|nr:hypothetical protein [Balneolaceae bacterium]
MERIIRNITDRLAEKLPPGREFYTPEDLQVLEIPEFITDRVIIEMNQNLSESLTPPDTEWASMDEQAVRFAWKNFLEAIKAEVRMPAVYARSLLETAVADTLELAVKPRVSIPDTLFGVDKELTVDLLKKRVRYITIGRKLAAALVRYMEKKERKSLSVEECREIITKVDERLMEGNNSLDWAKELDSLFQLAGPSVDTELLRIYFEDKGEIDLAERFDRHDGSVDRTEMIEIIAAPASTLKRQQKSLPKVEKKPDRSITSEIKSEAKEVEPSPGKEEKKIDEPVKKKPEESPEDSILAAFQKKRFDDDDEEQHRLPREEETVNVPEESSPLIRDEEDSNEDEERPIFSRFAGAEDEISDEEEENESEEPSIYKEMKLQQEKSNEKEEGRLEFDNDLLKKWQSIGGVSKDEDEPVLSETDKPEDEDEVDSIELYNETTDDEEVPMWRAFLDREDLSKVKDDENDEVPNGSMMRSELDDDSDEEDDDSRTLSELFGTTDVEDEQVKDDTSQAERLIDWMEAEEARFVKNIFSGNSKEYMQVLEEISRFENWKKASAFIASDIFEPRDVDVFDEVAVDFTDRLHTFFLEFKSK